MKIRKQKYITNNTLIFEYYDIQSMRKGILRTVHEILYTIRLFLYEHSKKGKEEISNFRKIFEKIQKNY